MISNYISMERQVHIRSLTLTLSNIILGKYEVEYKTKSADNLNELAIIEAIT
jgi:hypothetical protein